MMGDGLWYVMGFPLTTTLVSESWLIRDRKLFAFVGKGGVKMELVTRHARYLPTST